MKLWYVTFHPIEGDTLITHPWRTIFCGTDEDVLKLIDEEIESGHHAIVYASPGGHDELINPANHRRSDR